MLTLIIVRSRRLVTKRRAGVVRLLRVVARVVAGLVDGTVRAADPVAGGSHDGPVHAGRHIITAYSALAPFAAP
ncbi:hypothetical protein PSAB6_330058 [Paraburkholderia sabiae]|nr:hypothetical protein PSAB6_330058 [Paraburkholderia sabiae]